MLVGCETTTAATEGINNNNNNSLCSDNLCAMCKVKCCLGVNLMRVECPCLHHGGIMLKFAPAAAAATAQNMLKVSL